MKKLLITLAILAVLLFGGLFAIAKMAPIDRIKQEAVTQVKVKTGRDLSFSDAQLLFWPNIGVQLKDVIFSNADWSAEKNMVTLSKLDVQLAVMPLLKKQVEVKRFVLDRPVINLEKSADGRMNWDFNRGEAAAEAAEKSAEGSLDGSSAPQDFGFRLGEFEIKDGQLTYTDRQTGASHLLQDVDIKIDYPDLASAVKVDGAFDYKAKRVTLGLTLEKPLDFGGGKQSPGSLRIKSPDLQAAVQGVFSSTGIMLQKGALQADISSLSGLAAWLGDGKKAGLPFEKVSFRAAADGNSDKFTLTDASLNLDEVAAKGRVTLSFTGERPAVIARLSLNKLALDRFAGTDTGGSNADVGSAPQEGWDDTPIDFSGLKSVDADLVLDTEGFSLKGVDVGPSKLTATLLNGNLKASSSKASLFGGTFASNVSVNAAPAVPTLALRFEMDGVEAQPVLATFADFKKLSGKADASIDVTSSGKSQKEIVGNLNGGGSAVFRNGALTGIDLVNIAKAVQSKLTNLGIGEGKTEFVELGGTFKISQGVARNEDLKLKGPLLQASGKGDIDLPKKYVKYRVIPVLTASSAVDDAKGLAIPVDISGPFSKISVRPDLQSAIQGVLDNPDALKDTLKGAKEKGKELEGSLKELKKDPGAALQNLLGGGGLLGGKKAAAPAAVETAPAASSAVVPASSAAPASSVVAPEAAPAPTPAAPAAEVPVASPVAPAEAASTETVPAEEAPADTAPAAEQPATP